MMKLSKLIALGFLTLFFYNPMAMANKFYDTPHCINSSKDGVIEESDVLACNKSSEGYLCPIGKVACDSVPNEVTKPVHYKCEEGTLQGSVCKVRKKYCRHNHNNPCNYWGEYEFNNNIYHRICVNEWTLSHHDAVRKGYFKGDFRLNLNGMKYYDVCYYRTVEVPATPYCEEDGKLENGKCVVTGEPTFTCPLGESNQCMGDGAVKYCSANKCLLSIDDEESIDDNIDGGMLDDNGAKDQSGNCLDTVYIFSGRAQKCRPSGVSTAFKNCCKTDGKVMQDSTGSSAQTKLLRHGIKTVFDATKAAYDAYQAGKTAAEVGSAFQNGMMVGFDPTSIAISIAISLVMDYLMSACDQIEAETAMSNSSGMCVELGEFCSKKWFGKCVQKSRSFCCFNSKLARIINQQGRTQLNTFAVLPNGGFGEAKNPVCRGFTPEEFQAIDFGKIDLTEYYDDLIHRTQGDMQDKVRDMTEKHLDGID